MEGKRLCKNVYSSFPQGNSQFSGGKFYYIAIFPSGKFYYGKTIAIRPGEKLLAGKSYSLTAAATLYELNINLIIYQTVPLKVGSWSFECIIILLTYYLNCRKTHFTWK